jgi:hypothetical protein
MVFHCAVFQQRLHLILSSHLHLGVLKLCLSTVFESEVSVENHKLFTHCLTRQGSTTITFLFTKYQQEISDNLYYFYMPLCIIFNCIHTTCVILYYISLILIPYKGMHLYIVL